MQLKTQLVDTLYGKLNVFPKDRIGESVITHGYYEKEIIQIILQNCAKKGLAIDVGANIGTHTVAFGSQFEEVYSFEPQGEVFNLLEKNRKINKIKGKAFKFALGHTTGDAYINEDYTNDESNYGSKSVRLSGNKIFMTTLDSFRVSPDLIKVDIEGAEQLFFYGAKETIKEHRPVIFFEHDKIDEFMNAYHVYSRDVRGFDIFKYLMVELKYYRLERISKNYLALP